MSNLVIKKWIQPYLLIENLKDFYKVTELTFLAPTKIALKQEMFEAVNKGKIGLYMKNVNKFYILEDMSNTDLKQLLKEKLVLVDADLEEEADRENAISLVDLGKSEASFLF